ncbi:uncharacterized protein [Aquarana catesbeiana]|uniref:uncharacterized protein n=1 Tax=Aquarana catesbeiana TaxID=8400 RepID=UPI003CC99DDF
MASGDLRAELECSVCLNIYTDPVTLKCGHNFCRVCIDRVLDTQGESGGYSCPECREKFPDRPALHRNITLRNIVETFLSAQPDREESGVFCTYCVDSPVPAVRSCLHCEVSLCEKHLRVHKKSPEHILCDPTLSMESRKCSVHKEVLKYYCTEDETCICVTCSMIGGHKGHEMESLDEASEKKKETLRNVLQKLLTKREETEERVQSLREHRRKVEEEAAGDTERVTALFRDLRRRLQDLERRALRDISRQKERVFLLIRDLEIKKEELSRKIRHIEELCNMTDPLTVLQESDTGDLCDTEDGDNEDRERHEKLLHNGGGLDVAGVLHTGLSDIITEVNVYFSRPESEDILLDRNTAGHFIKILDDRKTVSGSYTSLDHPETPGRFQRSPQVLSSQIFSSGRHYWEVDVGGSKSWRVGVCYPSIERRGWGACIGDNNKSWGLDRTYDKYSVRHDNNGIPLSRNLSSNKVMIYLDYEAGRISFYDLCDPIQHLHTFTTTFTEPLHVVLRLRRGYIKLCGGGLGDVRTPPTVYMEVTGAKALLISIVARGQTNTHAGTLWQIQLTKQSDSRLLFSHYPLLLTSIQLHIPQHIVQMKSNVFGNVKEGTEKHREEEKQGCRKLSSASPCADELQPSPETFSFISLLLSAMASGDLRAELECSICLNIYTDPVTLKCGHNFCRVCIDRVLDTQEGSGGYSCPECREKFPDRLALQKNMKLRNIAETFLSAQPDREESGVFCTHCVDSPVPAVRSCLLCEVYLCDKHLKVHKKSPEHILCDPTLSMESRKCSVHKKILEYYCTEDDTCICKFCVTGEHRGHQMDMMDEASEKKKETLRNVLEELLTKREEMEERVQSLQEHRRKVEEEAAGDTERVTALFRDLRRHLEDLEKRVLRDILRKAERISISIRDLEIKKEELSRKMRHIEELCNMTDPLTVLQESDTGDLCDTEDGDNEDRERHEELLHDGGGLDVAGVLHTGLSDIITEVNVYPYIQGAAEILLDGNTAHNNLQISDDMKTVSKSDIEQNYPKTPERFQLYPQVMSSWSFSSGRHYWEVDVGGSDVWIVGMCYPSIERRGGESLIGRNKKSWGLGRYYNQYRVRHDSKEILLPTNLSSNRVRIYLDYEAGRISFYDLCDPIRHLHTFTTTFTEPLHAGIGVYKGCIKICRGR